MDAGSTGKVLFATFDVIPDPTGTSAQTSRTLKGLTAFHEVEVLSAKTPEHAHIERYEGARLLRVPVGTGDLRARAEAFSRAVRRQLQSEEYELVHFTDPYGGYPVCELRSTLGYRLVYEARSFPSVEVKYLEPELETDRAFITRLRRQEIFCLSNADVVLVPCELSRENVIALGVAAEKVHVSRPMVEQEPLAKLPPPEGEPCRILYLGSHASWQGLPSLLFALRFAMKRETMKVRIIGVTHGSWQRQLQEMIREFGLRDHVTLELPVPHEDIPSILAQTDVVVAPLQKGDRNQEQGACPMKLAEAMSAGRCVVTADLPITREIIEHEVSGLLYPPSDEDALGDLLVRVARDPALRTRLGEAARAASGEFDALHRRAALLHLYARQLSPEVELDESVFRVAPLDRPDQRPGDEATQPKAGTPEGPTSMASFEEIQSRLDDRDTGAGPESSTSPGAPIPGERPDSDGPSGEGPTGPRPYPEGRDEDTGQTPMPVAPEVEAAESAGTPAGAAAADAPPAEEDTGSKPASPEVTDEAEVGVLEDGKLEPDSPLTPADDDTGKKPVPVDPDANPDEDTGKKPLPAEPEAEEPPRPTDEDTGKKPVPTDPAAILDEDTGRKPVPVDPEALLDEDTGSRPVPTDPEDDAAAPRN